jgi:hypothetical protein
MAHVNGFRFLGLVQFAKRIIATQRSNLVLERVKNFLSRVRGIIRIFRVTPAIATFI